MAGTLVSEHEWQRARPLVTDSIAVQHLQCTIHAGPDIWGRFVPQPVGISVQLDMSRPFSSAAAADSLDTSTVNYGVLSKAILADVNASFAHAPVQLGAYAVCQRVANNCLDLAGGPTAVSTVNVNCAMAKGTRYGQGSCLTLSHCHAEGIMSVTLGLDKLAIPAIIGINRHERLMKQLVVVSATLDGCKPWVSDGVPKLEQIIAKTVEESGFETLEALAEELAGRVLKYFVFAEQNHGSPTPSTFLQMVSGLRIRLEKPSAVPLAHAPAIEIYRRTDTNDPYIKTMLAELGTKRPVIPFPLAGRLDEFLQSWKQD